jgi:hypothetical protein
MAKYKESGTFLVGESETEAIKLNERTVTGFIVSGSTITGTAVTFLVSFDGVTFYPLYDYDSSEVSITVAGSARGYNLNPLLFTPWNHIKARLGTSGSAVLQQTYDTGVDFIIDSM